MNEEKKVIVKDLHGLDDVYRRLGQVVRVFHERLEDEKEIESFQKEGSHEWVIINFDKFDDDMISYTEYEKPLKLKLWE